jgi:uncharacterized Tic20 family protein
MTTETPTETFPTTYEASTNSRNLALLSHLSAFVAFLGIPSLVGPLVVWLLNRDDPYVEAQAKDALNFNISFFLYGMAAAISIILLVGIVALPAVIVTWFVLVIVASVKAANGEDYRYPFTIQFVS